MIHEEQNDVDGNAYGNFHDQDVQRKIKRILSYKQQSRKISEYEMAKVSSDDWQMICKEADSKTCDSNKGVRKDVNDDSERNKCTSCTETFCKHKEMNYLEKYCFPESYALNGGKRSYTKKLFQRIENCSDGNFICMICGNFFSSQESMAMHQLIHGKQSSKESMAKLTTTKGGLKFQCPNCTAFFPSEFHLFTHTKRFHKNNQ